MERTKQMFKPIIFLVFAVAISDPLMAMWQTVRKDPYDMTRYNHAFDQTKLWEGDHPFHEVDFVSKHATPFPR